MVWFTCPLCEVHKTNFRKYARHLRDFHEVEQGFVIVCNIDCCKDSFRSVEKLVRHVRRKHREADNDNECADDQNEQEEYFAEQMDLNYEDIINADNDVPLDGMTAELLQKRIDQVQRHTFTFLLKLREKHLLPECVQEDIVTDMSLLIDHVHDTYRDLFKDFCVKKDVFANEHDLCHHLLSSKSVFSDIFEEFNSEEKLKGHLVTRNLMVEPEKIEIKTVKMKKVINYRYVPIPSVLKLVLSKDEVYDQIEHVQNVLKNPDLLCDYKDGTIFKSHEFFRRHPMALRLHFYADEFEVCNPIGAKRGKHKVFAVYYTIGNLQAKYRSQLKFIHLAILIRYPDMVCLQADDPSCKELYGPLMKDLDVLSTQGITISLHGNEITYLAALATFSGDNLSAHSIAGFQTYFNCNRMCRVCMIDHDSIGECFNEEELTIRSKEVHAYHQEAIAACEANKRIYGVYHSCALQELSYFEVTCSFPPDIMHDLLEGIVPSVVKQVLATLVSERICTLNDINSRLKTAIDMVDDKPNLLKDSVFKPSGSIIGSASQKWSLFLLLPAIVGEYVPEGHEAWEVYLLLRQITDIVFAPVISRHDLYHLQGCVQTFLSSYAAYFGSDSVTPKFHYLVHYSRMIEMFGPLRHLWCMRFEGKHQYFKSIIQSLGNYINVGATMANRHQLRQSWELLSSNILHTEGHATTKTVTHKMHFLPEVLRHAISIKLDVEFTDDEKFTTTNNLIFNHVSYSVNNCLVLSVVEEEEIPAFIRLKYVINIRNTWIICGRLCTSRKFCHKLHAYEVSTEEGWIVVYPGEEADYSSCLNFEINHVSLISPKYHVPRGTVSS